MKVILLLITVLTTYEGTAFSQNEEPVLLAEKKRVKRKASKRKQTSVNPVNPGTLSLAEEPRRESEPADQWEFQMGADYINFVQRSHIDAEELIEHSNGFCPGATAAYVLPPLRMGLDFCYFFGNTHAVNNDYAARSVSTSGFTTGAFFRLKPADEKFQLGLAFLFHQKKRTLPAPLSGTLLEANQKALIAAIDALWMIGPVDATLRVGLSRSFSGPYWQAGVDWRL